MGKELTALLRHGAGGAQLARWRPICASSRAGRKLTPARRAARALKADRDQLHAIVNDLAPRAD